MARANPNTQQPAEVNPQYEERLPEHGEMTTPSDLGFVPKQREEIEVDQVLTQSPSHRSGVQRPPMVTIRVNCEIEQMTYAHQGRMESYSFQEGHRYQVPFYIADELEALGKIWH